MSIMEPTHPRGLTARRSLPVFARKRTWQDCGGHVSARQSKPPARDGSKGQTPSRQAAFTVLVLLPMHCRISLPCGQKIDRRIATTTPPNRLTNQRRVLQRAGAMRMGAAMTRFGSNLYLTPTLTGLIMVTVLLLGAIVAQVITVSEPSEVRTHASPENGSGVTSDIGVADLRGSLP